MYYFFATYQQKSWKIHKLPVEKLFCGKFQKFVGIQLYTADTGYKVI